MTNSADRGKGAEATIKRILKEIESKCFGFTSNKNPDAYAAGGRAQPVAGDFQAFFWPVLGWESQGGEGQRPAPRNFIVEVKEVKHDFRLPYANYSSDKVARVQKRVHAGTEAAVAVLHTTTGTWRLVPQAVFTVRQEGKGSWDLRSHEPVDINSALRAFFGVSK